MPRLAQQGDLLVVPTVHQLGAALLPAAGLASPATRLVLPVLGRFSTAHGLCSPPHQCVPGPAELRLQDVGLLPPVVGRPRHLAQLLLQLESLGAPLFAAPLPSVDAVLPVGVTPVWSAAVDVHYLVLLVSAA